MTTDRCTVLLTSAGRRGALVDLLRDGGRRAGATVEVVAVDRSALSAAGHLADRFELVPPVDHPEYLDRLVELVARYGVDAVVPTIDPELGVVARGRSTLAAAGAVAVVSSPDTVEVTADKHHSRVWMAAAGFPVPRGYDRTELDGLGADAWPLFFKPRRGSSSLGAHPVGSTAEVDLAEARYGPGVVEERIEGHEITLDCWVTRDGCCRAVVPRRRLSVRAGEIANGVTVACPDLVRSTTALVEALPGPRGPVTVQAIVARDGPRFIEVNPRFGGGYPLSHAAGACLTAVLVAEALGRPPDDAWFRWRAGVTMLRYDTAVFLGPGRVGPGDRGRPAGPTRPAPPP
ncbi:MAG: ATP-grasp domain-containing protein [Acidimicrobiales bacterium]